MTQPREPRPCYCILPLNRCAALQAIPHSYTYILCQLWTLTPNQYHIVVTASSELFKKRWNKNNCFCLWRNLELTELSIRHLRVRTCVMHAKGIWIKVIRRTLFHCILTCFLHTSFINSFTNDWVILWECCLADMGVSYNSFPPFLLFLFLPHSFSLSVLHAFLLFSFIYLLYI